MNRNNLDKGAMTPYVYIIILNWNGWQDTVNCLDSVFRLTYGSYRVLVCDNGSVDGSIDRILQWAAGKLPAYPAGGDNPRARSARILQKPIPAVIYDRKAAESGGKDSDSEIPLVLVSNGENLGYAGGNNVGIRYALARDDFDCIWILNNDTEVDPGALSSLVDRIGRVTSAGLCGSTLLYLDKPTMVQSLGGFTYNRWFGTSRSCAEGTRYSPEQAHRAQESIECSMFGVQGASVLVTRQFLREIGLMNEEYFLYFEEQDWAARARGRFTLAYAPDSIVYHKEGASTAGESRSPETRSDLSDYYSIRSRILFTRNHFPWALPMVYLGLFGVLFNRLRRRQWGRLGMILRLALDPDRRFDGATHPLQDR